MLKTGSEEVSASASKMSSYTGNPCSLVDIYETLQVFKGALVSPWSLWNFAQVLCVCLFHGEDPLLLTRVLKSNINCP